MRYSGKTVLRKAPSSCRKRRLYSAHAQIVPLPVDLSPPPPLRLLPAGRAGPGKYLTHGVIKVFAITLVLEGCRSHAGECTVRSCELKGPCDLRDVVVSVLRTVYYQEAIGEWVDRRFRNREGRAVQGPIILQEMHMNRKIIGILLGIVVLAGSTVFAGERPNILWLTSEDNGVNWVGCYGNTHADTPNIDQLAKEGFLYTNCYASVPVCAPQRSTWITGIHAISMGTLPMRSRYPIPHDKIKYYPDYLKDAGYYCSNVKKTDYNIGGRSDGDCWNSSKLDWNVLKQKQPFFQIINTTSSHESRAFGNVAAGQFGFVERTLEHGWTP